MSRILTILLLVLAVGAVTFLAIFEPLTISSRQQEATRGSVMQFDPTEVKAIEISSGDDVVTIKREGEGWRVAGDIDDRASSAEVKKILEAANNLFSFDKISASEINDSKALNDYGLRKPKLKLDFKGDENPPLLFGKDAASDDKIYVRLENTEDVHLVSNELQKLVFRSPTKFRDPRLTDLTPDDLKQVIIHRKEGEMELIRDASGWRLMKPLNAAANEEAVKQLLNVILSLKVVDFPTGGSTEFEDSGDFISILTQSDQQPQILHLGGTAKDRPDAIIATYTQRSGQLMLPADIRKLVTISPEALREKKLLPINLDLVDAIRITSPKAKFSLIRRGEDWILDNQGKQSPASFTAIRRMADALSTAQVTRFDPATAATLASSGLSPATLTVSFNSILSENTPEAQAGEHPVAEIALGATTAGEIATRINKSPEIAITPEFLLNAIPGEPADWALPGGQ